MRGSSRTAEPTLARRDVEMRGVREGSEPMIVSTERPIATVQFENLDPPAGPVARAMALAYLQYASACWRGDRLASVFATRLGAFWRPEMPPAPAAAPD